MSLDDFEKLLEGILSGLKARKDIAPLRKENSELQDKLSTLTEKHGELEKKFKSLSQSFDELKNVQSDFDKKISKLQKKLSAAEDVANYYSENFGDLDKIYKLYLTLPEDTRYNLAGIFGEGKSVAGFFSGAIQESHIAPFWDHISRLGANSPERETLCQIFDFCFDNFNKGFQEPPFVRLNVEHGNDFDDEFMRRTSHSPQFGNVERVLLQGYKYRVGKIVKPSVVDLV